MKSPVLLYEDKPKYDLWLKLLLGGILAFTLVLGLAISSADITGTWVCLGATLFEVLLFWSITPRRYQIYQDRLRIQLGWPFAFNIALSSIKEAKKAPAYNAFAYWGIRFATSASNLVEIVRRGGMDIIISVADADTFLEQLDQARQLPPHD
jgi:hypothetical protein